MPYFIHQPYPYAPKNKAQQQFAEWLEVMVGHHVESPEEFGRLLDVFIEWMVVLHPRCARIQWSQANYVNRFCFHVDQYRVELLPMYGPAPAMSFEMTLGGKVVKKLESQPGKEVSE